MKLQILVFMVILRECISHDVISGFETDDTTETGYIEEHDRELPNPIDKDGVCELQTQWEWSPAEDKYIPPPRNGITFTACLRRKPIVNKCVNIKCKAGLVCKPSKWTSAKIHVKCLNSGDYTRTDFDRLPNILAKEKLTLVIECTCQDPNKETTGDIDTGINDDREPCNNCTDTNEGCKTDDDCPSGKGCNNGKCEDKEGCTDDTECGPNASCTNFACQCNHGFTGSETTGCIPISEVGEWGEFVLQDPCSVTCGGGLRTWIRFCSIEGGCEGLDHKQEPCNTHDCPGNTGFTCNDNQECIAPATQCCDNVCKCIPGYKGNPESGCEKVESKNCLDESQLQTGIEAPGEIHEISEEEFENAYKNLSHIPKTEFYCVGWHRLIMIAAPAGLGPQIPVPPNCCIVDCQLKVAQLPGTCFGRCPPNQNCVFDRNFLFGRAAVARCEEQCFDANGNVVKMRFRYFQTNFNFQVRGCKKV